MYQRWFTKKNIKNRKHLTTTVYDNVKEDRLPHLQSVGLSASSSRYLFWVRIRAKQLSLDPPEGNFGRSRTSLPSTIVSQLLCNSTIWWGGDRASWQTRRLPSAVRRRNRFFHCLKMNPPWEKNRKKRKRYSKFWVIIWKKMQNAAVFKHFRPLHIQNFSFYFKVLLFSPIFKFKFWILMWFPLKCKRFYSGKALHLEHAKTTGWHERRISIRKDRRPKTGD